MKTMLSPWSCMFLYESPDVWAWRVEQEVTEFDRSSEDEGLLKVRFSCSQKLTKQNEHCAVVVGNSSTKKDVQIRLVWTEMLMVEQIEQMLSSHGVLCTIYQHFVLSWTFQSLLPATKQKLRFFFFTKNWHGLLVQQLFTCNVRGWNNDLLEKSTQL